MAAFALSVNKSITTKELNSTEVDLVNGLKTGDKQAVAQLYKMYSGSLLGIITRIVKFDEIAEDILQDTFIKVWKSIDQYDASKGRLFTWLANLAKNTAIDHLRSKSCTNSSKTDNLNEIPIVTLDRRNYTQFNTETIGIKQLIQQLKPEQKNILDLVYFEGYTHAEVSEKLNIPLGTVKTKIRLSILALRRSFNETIPILKALIN
ncbi:RNA polymerase sigma factor [Pedobacter boryungensis]|uniref:RNA polymerase sigma factor n=1 Tax=Pedobacter boryungensis TaxID=869962 RepID=A0ABX2D9Y1_9SPHI|nr:RNA polymerase sigma factor [Pedobacter boryungensis]NQX30853.1 RNA polymerase sigma factor [Pedobacter boryungensis]